MATISPGPVFTVPDPVTGGAGAAVTVTEAFNAMWQNAQAKSASGDLRIAQAIAFADPAPSMSAPALDTSYLPPVKPTLPNDNPNNGEIVFNTQRQILTTQIENGFAEFIAEYFPNPVYYEDALDWCHRAFTEGGTGINADVEQQLWERARGRILSDSARATDEALSTWAGRRFPLPPGALTGQVNQINLDAGRKLAEQSRDIAIKSFEQEIENVRFAVKEVIDQRKVALDAAGEYIKTLMLAPQTAMQLATGLANIKSDFARNLVALYSAEAAALEPRVRLAITDAQLRMQASSENMRAQSASRDAKVQAATTGAQMVASMASAGINAINAQASISGNDSTSS